VQRLREMILQLAVMGKLVPQDPADEPASVLLQRIAAEKDRLIRDGKIKRPKPLPAIRDDEKPFELPQGWEWTHLGDATNKITDGTHHSPPNINHGEFLYITAKNIKANGVLLHNATYVSKEIHNEIYSRCDPEYGDLLYIKDGATTGVVTINNLTKPFSMLSSVALLKISRNIKNKFLLILLRSPFFYEEMRSEMTGVAITRVTLKKLNDALIPLPPLAEQQRIVAKVDSLMALCDKLETLQQQRQQLDPITHNAVLQSLAQTPDDLQRAWQRLNQHMTTLFHTPESVKALRETILQLAVMGKLVPQDPNDEPAAVLLQHIAAEKDRLIQEGKIKRQKPLPAIRDDEKPFELPNGWEWVRLDDLFNIIVDCPHSTPKFIQNGFLSLDTNSFKDGKLIKHKLRYVSENTYHERNRRLTPESGDIVLAREGSVGESIIIPDSVICCLGQRVMLLRASRKLIPEFLRMTISSPKALSDLLNLNKGIGAKHVNVSDIKNYVIALPPLAEQQRIVAKVDSLMALCDKLETRLQAARETAGLFAAEAVNMTISTAEVAA
jgi:type I restriction enzyme S subunit